MRNAAMRKLFVSDALYVAKHRKWCCLRFSNSSLYVEHNPGLQEQRVQNAEIGCCIAYRIVDVGEMIFKKCTWVQCTSLCDVNVLEMPRACLQFNHCGVLNDSNQQNHVGDRPFKSSRRWLSKACCYIVSNLLFSMFYLPCHDQPMSCQHFLFCYVCHVKYPMGQNVSARLSKTITHEACIAPLLFGWCTTFMHVYC